MSENETNIRDDLTRSLNIMHRMTEKITQLLETREYDDTIDHVYTSFLVRDLRDAETSLYDITNPVTLEVK